MSARRISGGVTLVRPGADGEAQEPVRLQIPCRSALAEKDPFDLLIFTVKAFATARAVEGAAHLIGPETVLVSLQNGLGNVEALQQGASLTDASHAAGFTDSAHANRVCHEMFGMSPSRASRHLVWR